MQNASLHPDALTAANPAQMVTPRKETSGSWSRVVSALTVLAVVFAGAAFLFEGARNGHAKDPKETPEKLPDPFAKWPAKRNPDLALVFSGQEIGYLQPCGCSDPQYGGLARRYNFLQSLKDRGWNLVAMNVGDIGQTHGPQALLKYRTAMRAFEAMGYAAVGLSKNEFLMPLSVALGEHSLNHPKPTVLSTNLVEVGPGGFWNKHNVKPIEVVEVNGIKVGILSIAGPTVIAQVEKTLSEEDRKLVKFLDPIKTLAQGMVQMKKEGVNVGVLLFQGTEDEVAPLVIVADDQRSKDRSIPLLYAALCLDKFSDPGDFPMQVGKIHTQIISLGHKGKNVGVLGFFRTGKGTELRYARVPIGPEFNPKDGDEKRNPVLAVMQDYADELKARDYLSPKMSPRGTHPTQVDFPNARYIGSEKCASCHEHAFEVWEKSHHHKAHKTLVETKFPTGRHYDPECIKCHTVGFEYKTGFADPPAGAEGAKIKKHNELLHGVGCESCHGPGSAHANNPSNLKLREAINPFRPKDNELDPKIADDVKEKLFTRRMQEIEWRTCQKCHDEENDVNWGVVGFRAKYVNRGIIHNTPKTGRGFLAWQAAEQRAAARAAAAPKTGTAAAKDKK